jgi:hypothetical protein
MKQVMRYTVKLLAVVLIVDIFFCYPNTSQAQNSVVRSKFYVGMDTGVGLLNLSQNDLPSQQSNPFALGFYGGVMPFKWLRTGIIVSGWLLEPYNNYDPAKGVSVSNTYLQIQAFPFKKFDLFLNVAGGISSYNNMHPADYDAEGTGMLTGLGYETRLLGNMGISLMINYGFGQFKDVKLPVASVTNQHYDITEFIIGFTYHFIPKKQRHAKTEKLRKLEEQ